MKITEKWLVAESPNNRKNPWDPFDFDIRVWETQKKYIEVDTVVVGKIWIESVYLEGNFRIYIIEYIVPPDAHLPVTGSSRGSLHINEVSPDFLVIKHMVDREIKLIKLKSVLNGN